MSTKTSARTLLPILTSAFFGLVFGFGLIVSHMVDPQRVADFLDITGTWNPALAFVMGGAILVAAPAFAYARRHHRSLLGGGINLPDRFRINAPLVAGAAIFGLGWGLSGICPGPGLVLLMSFTPQALVFVSALAAGILLVDIARGAIYFPPKEKIATGHPAD
ncbi:DUF6691 family protein [Parvibaculum sp.]|uniref:DUF6691 family protein n=1 Tax=Parvibaculum sp. TaxID=2024848 RepID=UPI00320C32E3